MTKLKLTPAQQIAADGVLEGLQTGNIIVLEGGTGRGKTSVVEWLQGTLGGVVLGCRPYVDTLKQQRPEALEESFASMMETALSLNELVFVDDFHLLSYPMESWRYPRKGVLSITLVPLLAEA